MIIFMVYLTIGILWVTLGTIGTLTDEAQMANIKNIMDNYKVGESSKFKFVIWVILSFMLVVFTWPAVMIYLYKNAKK